ncbi:hypothetical protein ACFLQU_00960 [Verrucomicrobiota bacterium]
MGICVEQLTKADMIERYVERFAELVGVNIPADYLRKGSVYGCFNGSGAMVGGYTLVTDPPYRGVVFLPDDIRNGHWFFRSISLDNVVEVNGVWLERSVDLSIHDRWHFWWQIVRSLRRTKKRYVLVWYNDLNKHLKRFYSRVKKEIIYRGQSAPHGGETTHPEICVAYTTRTKLYYSILSYLPRVIKLRVTKAWRKFCWSR